MFILELVHIKWILLALFAGERQRPIIIKGGVWLRANPAVLPASLAKIDDWGGSVVTHDIECLSLWRTCRATSLSWTMAQFDNVEFFFNSLGVRIRI